MTLNLKNIGFLVIVIFWRFLAAKKSELRRMGGDTCSVDRDYLRTGTAIGSRASHEH